MLSLVDVSHSCAFFRVGHEQLHGTHWCHCLPLRFCQPHKEWPSPSSCRTNCRLLYCCRCLHLLFASGKGWQIPGGNCSPSIYLDANVVKLTKSHFMVGCSEEFHASFFLCLPQIVHEGCLNRATLQYGTSSEDEKAYISTLEISLKHKLIHLCKSLL